MYSKTQGHHCWWLNKDGKALANFDNESDVDEIITLFEVEADIRATLKAANNNSRKLLVDKQKLTGQIKSLIQTHRDNSGYEPSLSVFQREIDSAESLITSK
tara:strand:+ start:372 stop:677 length:306 start_codon:yes stop_codon:yes gene_type:complete